MGMSNDSAAFIKMRVGDAMVVPHLKRTSWSKSYGTCHGLHCHVYQKFHRVALKHCPGTGVKISHQDKRNPRVAIVIKTKDSVEVPGSMCFGKHV